MKYMIKYKYISIKMINMSKGPFLLWALWFRHCESFEIFKNNDSLNKRNKSSIERDEIF